MKEKVNELCNKINDMWNKKTNDIVKCNKFGVPYHEYELTLNNGTTITVDVGCEEDWGDIQKMLKDTDSGDPIVCVGWGNDSDGHIEIVSVLDSKTRKIIPPMEWANDCVWSYADNYCQ